MRSLERFFGVPVERALEIDPAFEPSETAEEALAHLRLLLSEFSGDTTDY